LTEAIRLDPRNADAYINRGVAYDFLGRQMLAGLTLYQAKILTGR
jgi:Flp pilus assembly protein TadD